MSDLAARLDGLAIVVTALLASHLAHDINPRAAAGALMDHIADVIPPGEPAHEESRQIVAAALVAAEQLR